MRTAAKIIKFLIDLFKFSAPILVAFIVCYIIINVFKLKIGKIGDIDFLFTFFGILLGFAVTIFTFVVQLIENIRARIEEEYKNKKDQIDKFEAKIKNILNEIKDDIVFTFVSMLIASLFYITNFDFLLNINISWLSIELEAGRESLKLALFILNLYAIYDLMAVSFKMSDTSAILEINKQTP